MNIGLYARAAASATATAAAWLAPGAAAGGAGSATASGSAARRAPFDPASTGVGGGTAGNIPPSGGKLGADGSTGAPAAPLVARPLVAPGGSGTSVPPEAA